MHDSFIVVIRFSAMFGDIWRQLVDGVETDIRLLAPGDVRSVPRAAAVVLAAGGAERAAIEWLEVRDNPAEVPVLVVGSDPGRRTAAQVVAHGASDYFALPDDTELLRNSLLASLQRYHAASRSTARFGGDEAAAFSRIVGESPALKAVLQRATRLLPHVQGTVLIVGENGTGKELLARSIHDGGPRWAAPFVPVHCSASPRELLEVELFGFEKDAIPEAHAAKPGLFEVAHGGTLFLDEIHALAPDLQVKLLRVLEDHETRRLGASKARQVNVRVIAATTENLETAVRRGRFRRDLQERLAAITLELPPLRERGDDLVLVARRLLVSLAAMHDVPAPELRGELQRVLREHSWPGNVRELKNALERALLLSPPGTLSATELVSTSRTPGSWAGALPFPAQLDDIASAAARATLEACGGNVSEAARQLHVSRGRLRRLVRSAAELVGGAATGTYEVAGLE